MFMLKNRENPDYKVPLQSPKKLQSGKLVENFFGLQTLECSQNVGVLCRWIRLVFIVIILKKPTNYKILLYKYKIGKLGKLGSNICIT